MEVGDGLLFTHSRRWQSRHRQRRIQSLVFAGLKMTPYRNILFASLAIVGQQAGLDISIHGHDFQSPCGVNIHSLDTMQQKKRQHLPRYRLAH